MSVIENFSIPEYMRKMAEAIQQFEGWYPGSRAFRNNNPGNLRWFNDNYPWSGVTGRDESNHVIFKSYEAGFNALLKQLRLAFNNQSAVYRSGMSLFEFFSQYAEANQISYANYVANALGVTPSTTLEQIKNA